MAGGDEHEDRPLAAGDFSDWLRGLRRALTGEGDAHVPMLVDGACSIYEHRPRTCRTYDCRVFPAAGVEIDDDDQVAIARRSRRWRFTHPTEQDRVEHDAVRAAARFVREHPERLPEDRVPGNATQHAVLAVEIAGPSG